MTSRILTESNTERQSILNNRFALTRAEEMMGLGGTRFQNELVFTKAEVASLFGVDERTIDRYLNSHSEELSRNGYRLLRFNELKDFKNIALNDIHVAQSTKALGIFNFRGVLNLAMLLTESDRARYIRTRLLDIVVEVLGSKAGGDTRYINQRDEDFLQASFQEEGYRKKFTDAVDLYIDYPNQWKYAIYTNIIYKSIFGENAKEYRKILRLASSDKVRDTMYSEVLDIIASFEVGLAGELKTAFERKGSKLSRSEAAKIFKVFSEQPFFMPLLNTARTKMASRDLHFRDALHKTLESYIRCVPESDFDKFLGEKSMDLQQRIEQNRDVFKRLKDR